jgi:protein-L-isoaspartate(D-aspartate) O-methyltransferase
MVIRNFEDNYRHKGLRRKLVEEIRGKGIRSEAVLKAIDEVPRHWFLDPAFLEFAYQDKPFPIGCDQTISQPYTVAFQTELLDVKPFQKVLEIGTGSGYQACILSKLGARVFSIERQKKLYDRTKDFLQKAGFRGIKIFYGDGYQGLPAYAPFDRILITAAAPEIPTTLLEQLKPGGKMVLPMGKPGLQTMTLVVKNEDGSLLTEQHGAFVFVPMLPDKANGN